MLKRSSALALAAFALSLSGSAAASVRHDSGVGSVSAHKRLSLNVVVATPNAQFGVVFAAQALGLFAKNGLDVDLNPAGLAGTTALITSGQDDIAFFTAASAMLTAHQGVPTTVIYGAANNEIPMLVGPPGTTRLSQVQGLDGRCTLAGLGAGTEYYELQLIANSRLNLHCNIEQLGVSYAAIVAGVAAGRYQIGAVTPTFGYPAASAGQVTTLVDPLHPTAQDRKVFHPNAYPALVAYGLPDNLQQKRPAVVAFVKSLYQAGAYIGSHSAKQLAQLSVAKLGSVFTNQTVDQLTLAWQAAKNVIPKGPRRGYISPQLWRRMLSNLTGWGLSDFHPRDPVYTYAARSGMTYWKAAVPTKPAKHKRHTH
jgi:ABC-type nitrate/sulfonate/bicarbonate transport system substrate-binding protein